MAISGDGECDREGAFLLPLYPGEIWYRADVWRKRGHPLVDAFEEAVLTHMPKVLLSARGLRADGWNVRMGVCGFVCRPPRRVVRQVCGDSLPMSFAEIDEEDERWEGYFRGLGLPVLPIDCGGVPRGLAEVQSAESEAVDRMWYGRSVGRMIETGDDASAGGGKLTPPKVLGKAMECQMKMEEKYGTEELQEEADDPFKAGMVAGKVSALRWLMGDGWDALYT